MDLKNGLRSETLRGNIQAILRHSNVGLTMNAYVKSVSESHVNAMDALSEKFGICNDLATSGNGLVN
jgi:hypothetical protein